MLRVLSCVGIVGQCYLVCFMFYHVYLSSVSAILYASCFIMCRYRRSVLYCMLRVLSRVGIVGQCYLVCFVFYHV